MSFLSAFVYFVCFVVDRESDMRFTKMQGAGNDYIYVDCFRNPMPHDPPD